MTPQSQTTFGDGTAGSEPGNCLAACVASILDLLIAEVPNFVDVADWFHAMQDWLHARGWGLLHFPWPETVYAGQIPPGIYVIVHGWGPRGIRHSVVGLTRQDSAGFPAIDLAHDPFPDGTGLETGRGEQSVSVLFPLEQIARRVPCVSPTCCHCHCDDLACRNLLRTNPCGGHEHYAHLPCPYFVVGGVLGG